METAYFRKIKVKTRNELGMLRIEIFSQRLKSKTVEEVIDGRKLGRFDNTKVVIWI